MKRAIQAAALVVALIAVASLILLGPLARANAPVQPVAFDHWQHVSKPSEADGEGGPQLACNACHENADKSSHATIPNISTCMLCHESIKTDSPEVQKLTAFARAGQQPPWVRVYWIDNSADVFFTHKPHIQAGVDCAACHGDVGRMHRVKREINQTMGWCIECHKQRSVRIDCYICHR